MIVRDRKVTIDHDLVVGHTYEVVVRAIAADGRTQAVEIAPKATITIVGVTRAPAAPSALAATPFLFTIFLTWINPTDNDFDVTEVWRHTADDRASAVKVGELRTDSFSDNIGASGATRYYWIRSRNTSGVVSEWNATAGVSATTTAVVATDIADFAVTATKMFTNTIILTGDVWTNNSPTAGKIAWGVHNVVYGGASYAIMAGNTNLRYVYWVAGSPTYSTSATHPTLGTTGFMIATNEAGVVQLVWNSSANMVIGTAFIMDAAITNAKIDTMTASKLTAGTIDASVITVSNLNADNITAGTLTGRKVRTDTGGAGHYKRIELDVSDNTMRFYNASNANVLTIDDGVDGSRPGILAVDTTYGSALFLNKTTLTDRMILRSDGENISIKSTAGANSVGLNYSGDGNGINLRDSGGAGEMIIVALGGTLTGKWLSSGIIQLLDTNSAVQIYGTKVLGKQGAAVADATDAASVIARLNDLLARCRAHGLIAT